MKLVVILFLLCAYLPGSRAHAETADVKKTLLELETKMSGIGSVKTRFIQEKELVMFKHKIILEGMLFLKKPDRLAWHVQKPMRYSTIIDGDMIRQWDEETDQVHRISLIKNPVFEAVIAQMKMWFLGAYVDLESDYKVTIRRRNPFILEFIPRDTTVASSIINQIVVTFREDERYISGIRIEEKNGDSTQFTFIDTRLNSPVDPVAWKARFRVQ